MNEWAYYTIAILLFWIGAGIVRRLQTRKQRACVHHNRSTGETWLTGRLIDTGMRKMWACRRCGQTWI